MALAAMYQRIPYSILSEVNKKKPQNYSILKLPPSPNDKNSFAEWERVNPPSTTTFDQAKATSKGWNGPRRMGDKAPTQFKDSSFAKWTTRTFPKGIDFETALERIELSNTKEPRVLKYKLNFADGCHIVLARSNWDDPLTLYCIEAYNPNGAFEKRTQNKKNEFAATEGKQRQQFLSDDNGHLKNRKRDERGNPIHKSFRPVDTVGGAGYTFTAMSYNSFSVRDNANFPGVRPGLKETNKGAHQYLKKATV
eukprot:NODE_267_length_1049_cov_546.426247_g260_i0.p1 GENE.NODE_267_length_1049_cov_546.426247_g260_i0~~NODE_267_length_1049_cov_546.426247_g260_i0.p1  ORF type:complete len:252 (-),score=55.67 NODE_267_length_1049_cov_546.426247_g260_i0:219-974(-)